jgi:hypothetical protein
MKEHQILTVTKDIIWEWSKGIGDAKYNSKHNNCRATALAKKESGKKMCMQIVQKLNGKLW